MAEQINVSVNNKKSQLECSPIYTYFCSRRSIEEIEPARTASYVQVISMYIQLRLHAIGLEPWVRSTRHFVSIRYVLACQLYIIPIHVVIKCGQGRIPEYSMFVIIQRVCSIYSFLAKLQETLTNFISRKPLWCNGEINILIFKKQQISTLRKLQIYIHISSKYTKWSENRYLEMLKSVYIMQFKID